MILSLECHSAAWVHGMVSHALISLEMVSISKRSSFFVKLLSLDLFPFVACLTMAMISPLVLVSPASRDVYRI